MPFDGGEPFALTQLEQARATIAGMAGVEPGQVILGPTRHYLTRVLAQSLGSFVRRKAGVVLSRADSDWFTQPFGNLDATVRWAEPDLGTGQLPAWQYKELIDGATRLVVLSAAHPLLGTVAPTARIVETVRAKSRAWIVVDASAYAAYRPLNLEEWQADIVMLDMGELGGPQVSAMIFRDSSMFPRLDRSVKLEPDVNFLPHGLFGGVANLHKHLSVLDEDTVDLAGSMGSLAAHQKQVLDHLIESLQGLPAVHIMGVSGDAAGEDAAGLDRIPRLSFTVREVPAEMVHRRLMDNHLVTTVSPKDPLLDAMGVSEAGGSITIGLGPFNTTYEIDQLIRVLASLA